MNRRLTAPLNQEDITYYYTNYISKTNKNNRKDCPHLLNYNGYSYLYKNS